MPYVNTVSFGEALEAACRIKGASKGIDMAEMLGMSPSRFAQIKNNANSPKINGAIEVLHEIGFTLAVVPDNCELPEGSSLLRVAEPTAKRGTQIDITPGLTSPNAAKANCSNCGFAAMMTAPRADWDNRWNREDVVLS